MAEFAIGATGLIELFDEIASADKDTAIELITKVVTRIQRETATRCAELVAKRAELARKRFALGPPNTEFWDARAHANEAAAEAILKEFGICLECHGFDDYCADVALCGTCGGKSPRVS